MPKTKRLIRLEDCPDLDTLRNALDSDIADSVEEARTQAQNCGQEASRLATELPRDLCDGICDVLDTLENHADESVGQSDNAHQLCQDLESELDTLEEVLFQQLGRLKEIVDVGERDNAIKLIDDLVKQVCPSLVE